MTEFLLASALAALAATAVALVRVLSGRSDAQRMLAAQLLATGGVAALLLFGSATGTPAAVDLGLVLALLAAFAGIAFVKKGSLREAPTDTADEP